MARRSILRLTERLEPVHFVLLRLEPSEGRPLDEVGTPGAPAARFVFWYAFPRVFIDLFRDYPTHRLALGTGQTLNIVMVLLGAALLYRSRLRRLGRLKSGLAATPSSSGSLDATPLFSQRVAFVSLLALCLTIPSNWTQDIPSRYGGRHPGLEYSWLYPRIDTAPPAPADTAMPDQF